MVKGYCLHLFTSTCFQLLHRKPPNDICISIQLSQNLSVSEGRQVLDFRRLYMQKKNTV
jgi:hypothetical protein